MCGVCVCVWAHGYTHLNHHVCTTQVTIICLRVCLCVSCVRNTVDTDSLGGAHTKAHAHDGGVLIIFKPNAASVVAATCRHICAQRSCVLVYVG